MTLVFPVGWEIAGIVATISAALLAAVAIFTASGTAKRERRIDHQIETLVQLSELLATGSPSQPAWFKRVQILIRAADLGKDEVPSIRAVFEADSDQEHVDELVSEVRRRNEGSVATGLDGVDYARRWEDYGLARYEDEVLVAIGRRVGTPSNWRVRLRAGL